MDFERERQYWESGPSLEFRERVREEFDWEAVLGGLGIECPPRNSGGKIDISCVFHEERTPSLRLWPGGGFCCHGCGITGDRADFVRELLPGAAGTTGERLALEEFFADVAVRQVHPDQLRLEVAA